MKDSENHVFAFPWRKKPWRAFFEIPFREVPRIA
jgi:hypothetical protein